MKLQNKLILLSTLFATVGLTGCGNDSGSESCDLNETVCQSENKSFDADQCECVEHMVTCHLTQDSCQKDGKSFDADKCECVEQASTCHLTQDSCQKDGKSFDAGKCECVAKSDSSGCPAGKHAFGNTCEEDSIQNCGSHDNDCSANVNGWKAGSCTAGNCVVTECQDNYHLSTDKCVADTNACCGSECTNCETSNKLCSLGQCKLNCGTKLTACDDACVDTLSDSANCSVCGNNCPSSTQCQSGSCATYTLSSSSTIICDGKTVYPYNDASHCGKCGNNCGKGKYCAAGVCTAEPATSETTTYCDGKSVRADIDSSNCSGCGNECGKGKYCAAGVCTTEPPTSTTTTYCDGKLVYPYTDSSNCGTCGNNCGSKKCLGNLCGTYAKGDLFTFGHYEQDNDTLNGKEPITWRVLDKNASDQYLVISEKALDAQPYNTSYRPITWEKSTIRSWLNGYGESDNTGGKSYTSNNFIDAAFTDTEQTKIVSSNVPAHANPMSLPSPGLATIDKIFLLSITEAQQYFTDDADRQAEATQYTVKKDAFVFGSELGHYTADGSCADVHCFCDWWLRTPGGYENNAAKVNYDGSFDHGGFLVDNDYVAVRPALWLNL